MNINQELQKFLDRNEYRSMLVELGNVGDWKTLRRLLDLIYQFLYEYNDQAFPEIPAKLLAYKTKSSVVVAIANSYGYLDKLINTSENELAAHRIEYVQTQLVADKLMEG